MGAEGTVCCLTWTPKNTEEAQLPLLRPFRATPPPVFFLISMVFCAPTIGGLAYRHLTLLPAGPQADQAPGKDLGLRVLKGLWM